MSDELVNQKKYLVIKYFDTYAENEFYFDTEKEAETFANDCNLTSSPKTHYQYRGLVEVK